MLALFLAGPSYVPTLSGRPVAVRRDSAISMQLNSKFVNFDQDGVFEGRSSAAKPPLKLLTRLEDLGLLSSLGEAGVLSAAEEAGLFSKLESAGAYSSIEKLLPLADKLNVFRHGRGFDQRGFDHVGAPRHCAAGWRGWADHRRARRQHCAHRRPSPDWGGCRCGGGHSPWRFVPVQFATERELDVGKGDPLLQSAATTWRSTRGAVGHKTQPQGP